MNFCSGLITTDGKAVYFASANMNLDVTGYAFLNTPASGMAAVLGIRPEHVRIDGRGDMSGVVSLIEPMGNHQVVWIECNGNLLSSVVHDQAEFNVDERVRFSIDAARISLFDKSGEQRL